MNNKLFLPEIFDRLATIGPLVDRLQFMREQYTPALKQLCEFAWDKRHQFDVEIPEFKQDVMPMGFSGINLFSEMRRMYIFTKTSPANPARKKQLLYTLLMELSPRESKLVIDLLTGEICNYPGFDKDLVSTLCPYIQLRDVVENKETEKPVEVVEPVKAKKTKKKKEVPA